MHERLTEHPNSHCQLLWSSHLALPNPKLSFRSLSRLMSAGIKAAAIAAVGFASHNTFASNLVDYGQTYSAGNAPNPYSLFSGAYNPAAASLMLQEDEQFRLSWFFSFATATEFGQVDNFVDDIDALIDILEDAENAEEDDVQDTLDRFNRVIAMAGEDGYLKNTTAASLPGLPLYWNPEFVPGVIVFEANFASQVQLSVLADELIYDEQKETFNTSTAAYIKSALQKKISVGYSQQTHENLFGIAGSELYVGAKFNIYDVELSKQVFQFELLTGRDIEDVIKDEYKKNRIQSTAIGLDFGAVFKAPKFLLSASLESLNGPSFDYGSVGVNCDRFTAGSDGQTNCSVADYFANVRGVIDSYEQHKKDPRLNVSGSYFIFDNWLASASLDLVSHDDPVAGENQWFSASTSYHPSNFWVPGIRAGFKKNLTDEKLSYATVGFSIAKTFNLDAIVSLDDVVVEEEKAPRGFGIALSFEEYF